MPARSVYVSVRSVYMVKELIRLIITEGNKLRIRLISCAAWILLLIAAPCLAPFAYFGESPETFSAFTGARLYSRTLSGEEQEETVQQVVMPLFVRASITEDWSIRVYQTVSSSQLQDGPSLTGLESTRIRTSLNLFGGSVITYVGCSLPIVRADPEIETAHLSNLLYDDALQFGVNRLAEGFDVDAGAAFAYSFGDLSLGLGVGYLMRGTYDTLLYGEDLAEYNPGDAINASAGLHFRRDPMSLRARGVYVHYTDDMIEGDNAFKSGDEISFLVSAAFQFDPLSLLLFAADTIKGESDALQEELTISNVFSNRLNGGILIAYELLDEILLFKTQASVKSFWDDGNVEAQVVSFDGGFQLIPIDNLTIDISTGFIYGDIDAGETDISGFNLGLIINYGF